MTSSSLRACLKRLDENAACAALEGIMECFVYRAGLASPCKERWQPKADGVEQRRWCLYASSMRFFTFLILVCFAKIGTRSGSDGSHQMFSFFSLLFCFAKKEAKKARLAKALRAAKRPSPRACRSRVGECTATRQRGCAPRVSVSVVAGE